MIQMLCCARLGGIIGLEETALRLRAEAPYANVDWRDPAGCRRAVLRAFVPGPVPVSRIGGARIRSCKRGASRSGPGVFDLGFVHRSRPAPEREARLIRWLLL